MNGPSYLPHKRSKAKTPTTNQQTIFGVADGSWGRE
jgi:hypothetical protein